MNLHKRLHALEQRLTSGPVTLIMPDGRTEMLRGDCMVELLSGDQPLFLQPFAGTVCVSASREVLSIERRRVFPLFNRDKRQSLMASGISTIETRR